MCKIGDENVDTTHTARFNAGGIPMLYGISQAYNNSSYTTDKMQIELSDEGNPKKETVRIEGYNLDLTTPSIQLYDSTGAAYYSQPVEVDTSSVVWTATGGSSYQKIETEINAPTVEGYYTVKVLFDGNIQADYSRQLQIYDVAKFTSFEIPTVSITKEDSTVKTVIFGENFDTPSVKSGIITATCSSKPSIVANPSFTIINDNVISATFTIPGTAGDYDVTVTCGANSITGSLKAKDFSTYSAGDVLLNDGTIIPYDANNLSFTDEQKQKAVGILYFNEYDAPCGYLGIYTSEYGTTPKKYKWTVEGTKAYDADFNDINCYASNDCEPETAVTSIITGDTDGSDNWDYICSIDPVGTADAAIIYPAFNYVNNYASTSGLTGDYATGWYMPSLPEMCYIYRCKDKLNEVLYALRSTPMGDGSSYWSSSQCYDDMGGTWIVHFGEGGVIIPGARTNDCYVCAVRHLTN